MRTEPTASRWTWRRRFSLLTVFATMCLISWGGFVTSIEAGMAFPDWPTSLGSYNLINPMDEWWLVTPYLAEHGHRLMGALVGILTMILAAWTWWGDDRRWMRHLGLFALFMVTLQGVLGGLRVLYVSLDLAVVHACTAQIFFATLVAMTLFTTDTWRNRRDVLPDTGPADAIRYLAYGTTALIYMQIILGALLRHPGRGVDGGFALIHITGAFLVVGLVMAVFVLVQKHYDGRTILKRAAWGLVGAVGLQFALGLAAYVVMLYEAPEGLRSNMQILLTVGHLVVGSVLFGSAVVTSLLVRRAPDAEHVAFDTGDGVAASTPLPARPPKAGAGDGAAAAPADA